MIRPSAAALALLLAAPGAWAAPPGSKRVWDISAYSWVKRIPAEPGAALNTHPVKVAPGALRELLASILLIEKDQEEALFAEEEAAGLAKAISAALALSGPGEDLEVISNFKRSGGLLNNYSSAVTARAFVKDGRLHLIVGDARLEYVLSYQLTFQMPDFPLGSRGKASKVVLRAPNAENLRPDWVALPLGVERGPATAEPAPPPAATKGPAPTPAAAPALAAPPVPPPAAKAAPVPTVQAPAKPARSAEERLQELKRLREKDLITEEEYRKRKEEILKEI